MSRRLAVLGFTIGAALAACQVVAGIERVDKVELSADAAPEAAPVDPGGPADPCSHVAPPEKPAVDDDPTGAVPPLVMALRSMALTDVAGSDPVGFDLDHVCTCDTRPGARLGVGCVTKASKTFCDDDGGVDRTFATAFELFGSAFDIDKFANSRIEAGKQTMLIFIRNYNGLANDREVEIGLAVSNGITLGNKDAVCPGSTIFLNPSTGFPDNTYVPTWCGTDPWTTASQQMFNDFPVAFALGHVVDHKLVALLERAAVVPFGELGLALGSPIAMGTLVPLDENLKDRDPALASEKAVRFRLEAGVLAGRVAAADFLAAAGNAIIGQSDDDSRLCQNVAFTAFRSSVCSNLDIAKSSSLDEQPGYACDAISASLRFTAFPAVALGSADNNIQDNPCIPVDGGPREPSPYARSYSCD